MKIIIATISVLVISLISESQCGIQRELFECSQGVPYIENSCNACHCITDNELVCSLRKCKDNRDSENCITGSVWKEDCNKCWCTNAGTVCTNYKCSSY